MAEPIQAHLTTHGSVWCEHMGTFAGSMDADEAGVHDCGYDSISAAERAARKLRTIGLPVEVVRGECPEFLAIWRKLGR